MRSLWHRLSESPQARLLRIRRLGFFRFCALYAVVFPVGHALAVGLRATLIGTVVEFRGLSAEIAGWSAAGALVAASLWLVGTLWRPLREESASSRRATSAPSDQ